ncbi:transcription factor TGAL5-like [Canna indica]|uniref:Transcription factor TGAL5-like n=1 Tax=Canna indica TaxID=4628 RepID=A0AAQ3KD43_9LILI|nr:transcription factor TGAL5-like [Canna indica]
MASHRVGETGFADSGPSTRSLTDAIQRTTPAAAKFFDQEGATYFGELEEALLQGVDGMKETEDRNSFLGTKPPTLEIFPPWPIRFQKSPRGINLKAARSTDSGSAQKTVSHLESESPGSSRRASSDQSADNTHLQEMMMASGESQEKTKMTASAARKDGKVLDAKTLRRLAQNREAARKSRLRKKAYVQQLESSRIRLQQIEQDLHRARSQGLFLGAAGTLNGAISTGAAMFDMEYARWLEENSRHMSDLRAALQAHLPDANLGVILDHCISHYDDLFQLKAAVAKTDVFHLFNGTWKTPAERCFLWMGGFRPSELIKMVMAQVDPLTDQQLMGICSLQQSSQQAEEALSQGLEQLHHSLAETVAAGGALSLGDGGGGIGDVGNYMSFMAAALGKLASIEGFVREADNLRQQTFHQLRRRLTMRQTARCFLAIGEYYTRLRALSSLWASRPRDHCRKQYIWLQKFACQQFTRTDRIYSSLDQCQLDKTLAIQAYEAI